MATAGSLAPKSAEPRHEHVGPGPAQERRGGFGDAAVHLQADLAGRCCAGAAPPRGSFHRRGDELLPAKAGVDGHHQQQVDVVEHVADGVQGRCGVERKARARAEVADVPQGALQVRRALGVHGEERRARADEGLGVAVRVLNHEVDVQRQGTDRVHGADHVRAKGDVGNEPAVHDVHVQEIGPGGLHAAGLLAHAGKVRGEHGCGNCSHTFSPIFFDRCRVSYSGGPTFP